MHVYPGLPRPRIEALLSHEESKPRYGGQAEFYLGKVEMPCNVGTYLDSPFHRYRDGPDLSEIPLENVAGLPGIVLNAEVAPTRSVILNSAEAELHGRAVLIRTGWDTRWGSDSYWEPGSYLSG